jgi:hypothetical protein
LTPFIDSIFIGGPKALRDDRGDWFSSIARQRAHGAIHLTAEGFAGDKVAQSYHGGPDAALCVHLAAHYGFWRERYGVEFEHGFLGENLVIGEMAEAEVCVGDVDRLGGGSGFRTAHSVRESGTTRRPRGLDQTDDPGKSHRILFAGSRRWTSSGRGFLAFAGATERARIDHGGESLHVIGV